VSLSAATSVFRRRPYLFVSKYLLPLQEPLSLVIGFAFWIFPRSRRACRVLLAASLDGPACHTLARAHIITCKISAAIFPPPASRNKQLPQIPAKNK
jgi:hypothetical protein